MKCNDVDHEFLLVYASRSIGGDDNHDHQVLLCKRCGEFNVSGRQNGQFFSVSFVLSSDESVKAAGQYHRMLIAELTELKPGIAREAEELRGGDQGETPVRN